MIRRNPPRLFGIKYSNRDFRQQETWGKNQFNSSFPTSLACYMFSKHIEAVYLKANENLQINKTYISISELFGINPLSNNTYFAFETPYLPFQQYICGSMPRNDLVVLNRNTNSSLSSFEIKLTALPDNSTCELEENEYGTELVIRPDTIIYLACSIISKFENNTDLRDVLGDIGNNINDWTEPSTIIPLIQDIRNIIKNIVYIKYMIQKPLIIQPIWKTEGKSSRLAFNCLDIFVWSDLGMLNLFLPNENERLNTISRHTRSMVWLYKMLWDYSINNQFNGNKIIDELSYNTKNDKAFSSNGSRTHPLMQCDELIHPRIQKNEIKNIILGGGQNLLSPERRFDAIIYNSPELFD